MNKTIKIISFVLLVILLMYSSHHVGYVKGFNTSIDTVDKILSKQLNSDTTVTKLVLIGVDTNVYIISRKTIKK